MKLKELIIQFLKQKGKATYRQVVTMAEEQNFIEGSISSCLLTMHKKGKVFRSQGTSNRYYSLDPEIANTIDMAGHNRKPRLKPDQRLSVGRFDQLLRGVRG